MSQLSTDRLKPIDELERQIYALRTVSNLMLTNDEEIRPSELAGLLNVFLDSMTTCLNQIDRGAIHG